MAATSTLGLARAALVTALDTGALAGNAYYAWPGPLVAKQSHELVWIDAVPEWTMTIPNIKAGRKQRQETYVLELVLWVAKPEETAEGAQATFERALVLLGVIEDALANDVQVGETAIQWTVLEELTPDLVPYEKGWGCQIVVRIRGNARLT